LQTSSLGILSYKTNLLQAGFTVALHKKFNLNDSIKNKKHFSNSENPIFGQLMSDVQKDKVELAKINFEIDKS